MRKIVKKKNLFGYVVFLMLFVQPLFSQTIDKEKNDIIVSTKTISVETVPIENLKKDEVKQSSSTNVVASVSDLKTDDKVKEEVSNVSVSSNTSKVEPIVAAANEQKQDAKEEGQQVQKDESINNVALSTSTATSNVDKVVEENKVVPIVDVSKVSTSSQTAVCKNKNESKEKVTFAIEKVNIPSQPNYYKKTSWASFPDNPIKYKVDVFYVYPAIYVSGESCELMDISNKDLCDKAKKYVDFNTGIFKDQANIYAPYYRQASIEFVTLNKQDKQQILSTPINDIENAFKYYLENYNSDKPFILVGFSEGSQILLELLKNKFHNTKLQEKLIAAYIIGCSVTEDILKEYPFIKMAQKEDDFGVVISYNTQIANTGYKGLILKNSKAINPISWTINNKPSKEKQYKGAIMYDDVTGKISDGGFPFKTAYLEKDTNALVVDVDTDKYSMGKGFFAKGILHCYDYLFFYNNLQDNAKKRIEKFMKKYK